MIAWIDEGMEAPKNDLLSLWAFMGPPPKGFVSKTLIPLEGLRINDLYESIVIS